MARAPVSNGKAKVKETEASKPTAAPAQDAKSQASSIGAYLASDNFAIVNAKIEHLLEIREEERVGTFTLWQTMDLAEVDWDKFAHVGTSHKDKPNFIPETISVWNPDKGKYVDANWFKIAWANSPLGLKYQVNIDDAKLALDPKTAGESKMYGHMKTDHTFLKDEIKLYNGRMQSGCNMLRTAVEINQQLDRIEERKSVVVRFNMYKDKDGVEKMKTRTKYPFKLCEAGNESVHTMLTISDFLKIGTTDKHGEVIDTFEGLIDTLKTEPKTPAQAVKVLIQSVEKSGEYALAMLTFYNPENDEGIKHRSALTAYLAKDANTADLKAWGDFFMAFDPIWTVIQPLYDKLTVKTIGNRAATAAAFLGDKAATN